MKDPPSGSSGGGSYYLIKKQLSCFDASFSFLSIQNLAEPCDELLRLVHAQAEWWQQADRVGSGYSCKYFFFKQQFAAYLFDRFFKLDTYHQAAPANFFDSRQLMQFIQQISPYFCRIVDQLFILHDLQHGNGSRTG